MPLPNQWALARFSMSGTNGTKAIVVAYFVPIGGPADPTTVGYMPAFATTLSTSCGGAFRAAMGNDARYDGVRLTLHDSGVTRTAISRANAGVGAKATPALPVQNAAVVRKETGAPGRGAHGRWFIPYPAESDVTGEFLTAGGLTDFNVLGSALKAPQGDPNGIQWEGAHLSRHDVTLNPITGIEAQEQIASQDRRRLRQAL